MASSGPGAKPSKTVAAKLVKAEAAKPAVVAAKPVVETKPVAKPAPVTPQAAPVAAKAEAKPVVAAKAADAPKAPEAVKTVEIKPEAAAPAPASITETPVAAIAAPTSKEAKIMQDTIKKTTTEATERAKAVFGDINERTKTAMEKSTKLFEDAGAFHKGNLEAVVESAKIAAKGFETLGQDAAEYSRKSFEQASATLKSLAAVKSPTDFFKLQSDYARSAFDAMVAETSRSTEAMLKLAGEVAQPISNRVAVAVEKVKIAA